MSEEQPTPRGFQFGLRHLIVAMVVLSVMFALLLAAPGWVASATGIILTALAAAGLTAAIVYGRDNVRAFGIGALFPVVVAALPAVILIAIAVFEGLDELDDNATGMRVVTVAWVIVSGAAGILSVIVRRCLSRGE